MTIGKWFGMLDLYTHVVPLKVYIIVRFFIFKYTFQIGC